MKFFFFLENCDEVLLVYLLFCLIFFLKLFYFLKLIEILLLICFVVGYKEEKVGCLCCFDLCM